MDWVNRYIGLRFVDGGRARAGVDCWGLVRLVYASELAIELPEYGEISAHDLIAVARNIDAGKDGETWQPVEITDLREFDICVMKYLGLKRIGHVGVITKQQRVLHIEDGIDAMQVPLNHVTIKGRIACFRRHKKTIA